MTSADGTAQYSYDSQGQLTGAGYSPLPSAGATTGVVPEGEGAVGGGTQADRYDLTQPGNVVWPLTDNVGTVRDLAVYNAQTGVTSVANHRVYDSFGNLKSQTNAAVDCLFGFTGRPLDPAGTGLQNNAARWYDAATGGWLSPDPAGFTGGDTNLYRYVSNSPRDATDPTGQDRRIIAWLSHAIIEVRDATAGFMDWLDFGPDGYQDLPPYDLPVGTFPVTPWTKSTAAQDQALINLWGQREKDRKAGTASNWNPV